jgi:hypothetical protein
MHQKITARFNQSISLNKDFKTSYSHVGLCLQSINLIKIYMFLVSFSFFSSPGPKVHGNYCHHLASVVCKLFIFEASSPKPLGQLEPNLAGMFLGWSSTKYLFFLPVGYSTWLPGPIICSDWLKFQRSSSLKLMN